MSHYISVVHGGILQSIHSALFTALFIHMIFVASFMKRKFVLLLHCAANHYYTKKVFVFLQYDILLLQMCLALTLSSVAEKT